MIISKVLTLNPIKSLVLMLAAFFLLFTLTSNVFSQSPTQSASTSPVPVSSQESFNITYPVEALGNCKDLGECTNYCEDPVNYNSCASFAKENGFYRDDQTAYGDDEFWTDAEDVLGCNSQGTCFDYCSEPANFDICESYAKSNEIPGGYVQEPDKPEYLAIAQTTLGCNSAETCSTFCDNPSNAQACSDFADQVGLLGGTTQEGPGGCQTPGTCSSFCSDPANFTLCTVSSGPYTGPRGCTSEATCRTYCEQNPNDCRSFAPG